MQPGLAGHDTEVIDGASGLAGANPFPRDDHRAALAGGLAGRPVLRTLPGISPTPEPWESRSFSWPLFLITTLAVVMVVGPLVFRVITAAGHTSGGMPGLVSFPRWGWLGIGTVVISWILAWNRVGGSGGLLGIGFWPEFLFPAVWVVPLLLIVALQTLTGQKTLFFYLQQGDWRPIWLPALAGLICGFFWGMWNYYSLSRWEYTIPQVHGFHLFEMPLLGYAGYLPFGLTCVAIVDFFLSGKFDLHKPTRRR